MYGAITYHLEGSTLSINFVLSSIVCICNNKPFADIGDTSLKFLGIIDSGVAITTLTEIYTFKIFNITMFIELEIFVLCRYLYFYKGALTHCREAY